MIAAAESLRTSSEGVGAQALAGTCAALRAAVDAAGLDAARFFCPPAGPVRAGARELDGFADSVHLERAWQARSG